MWNNNKLPFVWLLAAARAGDYSHMVAVNSVWGQMKTCFSWTVTYTSPPLVCCVWQWGLDREFWTYWWQPWASSYIYFESSCFVLFFQKWFNLKVVFWKDCNHEAGTVAQYAEQMSGNTRLMPKHIIHNGVVLPGKWNVRNAIPEKNKNKDQD